MASYWMKKMPTREGWYLARPKCAGADEYYAAVHVYHLHRATTNKGWDDMDIEPGKICWGSRPSEDTFPWDFLNYCVFQALTLPEASNA